MPGVYYGEHSAMQAVAGDRAGLWFHSAEYSEVYEWYCTQTGTPMSALAVPYYVVYDTTVFFTDRRSDLQEYSGSQPQACIEVVPSRREAEKLVVKVLQKRQKQKAKRQQQMEAAKQANVSRLRALKAERKIRDDARALFTKRAQKSDSDSAEDDDEDEVEDESDDDDGQHDVRVGPKSVGPASLGSQPAEAGGGGATRPSRSAGKRKAEDAAAVTAVEGGDEHPPNSEPKRRRANKIAAKEQAMKEAAAENNAAKEAEKPRKRAKSEKAPAKGKKAAARETLAH
jgi:hypothetical protein